MNLNLNPWWVVGFVDGEGCFRASLIRSPKLRFQTQIQMEFVVVQHNRDPFLLEKLVEVFCCGKVEKAKGATSSSSLYRYRVRKLQDLLEKVIPFFDKHPLQTKKHVEFLKFKELRFLLKKKSHLNEAGFYECLALAKSIPFNKTL